MTGPDDALRQILNSQYLQLVGRYLLPGKLGEVSEHKTEAELVVVQGDEKVGAAVTTTMILGILWRSEAVISQRRDCFALCFK